MPGTWDALRVWINEQESTEIHTGKPAALTPAQRHAIAVLVPDATPSRAPASASASSVQGPAPAPMLRTGPEVDPDYDRNTDWVSLLHIHLQQNEYQPPKWEDRALTLAPKMPVKFELLCTVPDMEASFPNEDYGFVRGEAPCFSTKKDAKKYAAMWAIRCVNDLISPPPRQYTPKPPTPRQSTPKHLQPEIQDPENTNGVPLKRTNGGPSARKEKLDDEPDALRQVPGLCKSLGMVPPRFQVTPHSEVSTLFDVRPIFSDEFIEGVPPHLGEVTGMLGKKAAKEASAEQVLEWLKKLEWERDREVARLSDC